MKAKPLLITVVILFLVFVGIWIISPRVGEKVIPNEGVEVEFENTNLELPEKLPDGFVRIKEVTDAVVYKYGEENGVYKYCEYVGKDEYAPYDPSRPSYFVKSSFNKKIYQIKNSDGSLRDEYRTFDGTAWRIVSKDYQIIMNVPENYKMITTAINLYLVDNEGSYSYKLLTQLSSDRYAWLSPKETNEWIETTVPSNFEKTSIPNVYKGIFVKKQPTQVATEPISTEASSSEMKPSETKKPNTTTPQETVANEIVYKKVLIFNDKYKTVAVVSCDKDGNFI